MVYSVGGIEVLKKDLQAPEVPLRKTEHDSFGYHGLHEGTTTLPKGHQKLEGRSKPLPCDMVFDRDTPVPLRDGVRIRIDTFRPTGDDKVPAILNWSPYGKSGCGQPNLCDMPFRAGIAESRLSGYEKFEGTDPADFVPHGYAVVNADARGLWDSEGDAVWNSTQEGRDGYDLIEWIAKQDWCNGRVTMAGNSWLVQAMWHIAALNPPSLKCIAPWEGHSDMYRETFCRGGVPSTKFWLSLSSFFRGRGQIEDPFAMLEKYPLMNEYWNDKRVELHKISIPAYILASYSTGIHTAGTVRGYRELNTRDKWLRFHPYQEWFDLYQESSTKDLLKFFDYYLKDVKNDWPETPKVRLSLLNMGSKAPVLNQAEEDYPIPRTVYKKLYLDNQSGNLVDELPSQSSVKSHQSDDNKTLAKWTYKFDKQTSLAGYSKAKLYVSCDDKDDLDLHVQIRKLDTQGKEMNQINYPLKVLQDVAGVKTAEDVPWQNITRHLGPNGVLRASHRAVDASKGTDFDPYHPHDEAHLQMLAPGTIVPVEIGLWPMGLIFSEGESLQLTLAGHQLPLEEWPGLTNPNSNVGLHHVHSGGEHESYLQIPVI